MGLPLVTYNPSRRVKPSSRKLSKPRSTRDVPELNRPHSANIPQSATRQTATKKIQKLVAAGAPQALSSRPTRSITKPRRLLEVTLPCFAYYSETQDTFAAYAIVVIAVGASQFCTWMLPMSSKSRCRSFAAQPVSACRPATYACS